MLHPPPGPEARIIADSPTDADCLVADSCRGTVVCAPGRDDAVPPNGPAKISAGNAALDLAPDSAFWTKGRSALEYVAEIALPGATEAFAASNAAGAPNTAYAFTASNAAGAPNAANASTASNAARAPNAAYAFTTSNAAGAPNAGATPYAAPNAGASYTANGAAAEVGPPGAGSGTDNWIRRSCPASAAAK
jgi:hypothetical protein